MNINCVDRYSNVAFACLRKKELPAYQSEYKTKTSFRARDARSTVSFVLADLQSLPLMFAYVEDI